MKILTLGSSGFVGSNFIKFSKHRGNLLKTSNKVKSKIRFDITKNKIGNLFKSTKFDRAIIMSAKSNPLECKLKRKYCYDVNVSYTKKLIDFFINKNLYFIVFSSEYVYSGKSKKYNENSQAKTKMIYGKQKIEIDKYLKKKKYKNYSILRLSKTYGDEIDDGTFCTKILNEYIGGKREFKVASDQFFSPLYIKDLVKIIDLFIKNKIPGEFNVGGNLSNSRFHLIKKFFKFLNIRDAKLLATSISNYDNGLNIPKNVTFDIRKIKKRINFKLTEFPYNLKKLKRCL